MTNSQLDNGMVAKVVSSSADVYTAGRPEKNIKAGQRILVLESDAAKASFISETLRQIEGSSFLIDKAETLEKACVILGFSLIDIVLLNLYLSDSRGLATVRTINSKYPRVTIIILADGRDQLLAAQALQGGAQDFLIREKIDPEILKNAIYYGQKRKLVEEKLRNSEMNFRRVLESSADAILTYDSDGIVFFANEAAIKMFSERTIRLVGSNFGKELMQMEGSEIGIGTGQDRRVVEIRVVDLEWQGEKLHLASFRDITARKKREVELREQQIFLDEIIEGDSIPTFVLNKDHEIIYWNRACQAMTGIPSREMIGTKEPWKAFYAHRRPVLADLILNEIPNDEIFKYYADKVRKSPHIPGALEGTDYIHMAASSSRWLFFTAAPLRDGRGNLVGAIETLQDITPQKMAERKLKRRTLQLKHINRELRDANQKIIEQQKALLEEERLKVILQITGAAAHDLKQPLTSLLGHIDLIRTEINNRDNLEECIAEIEEAGRRITAILNRFRNIPFIDIASRIQTISLKDNLPPIKLLFVEDDDFDYDKFSKILSESDKVTVVRAGTLAQAQELYLQDNYDAVLLDYLLPDGNGMEFMEYIRQSGREAPVIVLTGQGDELIASRFIQGGAYDYLTKATLQNGDILRQSLLNALEKSSIKLELKRTQDKLVEMSTHDSLTSLYNRRFFMESLETEFRRMNRYNLDLVFCMIDLDDFKQINDTYGHQVGDMVLAKIGEILRASFRKNDLLARFGGEEFAVLLGGLELAEAQAICKRFRERVASHIFYCDGREFSITASIGLATPTDTDCHSSADLIMLADKALYTSKNAGKNRVSTGFSEHGI